MPDAQHVTSGPDVLFACLRPPQFLFLPMAARNGRGFSFAVSGHNAKAQVALILYLLVIHPCGINPLCLFVLSISELFTS